MAFVMTPPPIAQRQLGRGFWSAVGEVVKSNAAMDFLSATRSNPVYHFDSERVDEATAMLRQAWSRTLLSARAGEHQSARRSLGQLFHSLQVGVTLWARRNQAFKVTHHFQFWMI